MLRTLGRIFIAIGKRLAPEPSEPLSPTEQFLRKVKADFKKKRLINPSTGRLDMRYNPMAIDDSICCGPLLRAAGAPDPSEELAFLEWAEEQGIKLPKKDILKNDNQWHGLDINYNPMENSEDYFIPQRDVA